LKYINRLTDKYNTASVLTKKEKFTLIARNHFDSTGVQPSNRYAELYISARGIVTCKRNKVIFFNTHVSRHELYVSDFVSLQVTMPLAENVKLQHNGLKLNSCATKMIPGNQRKFFLFRLIQKQYYIYQ